MPAAALLLSWVAPVSAQPPCRRHVPPGTIRCRAGTGRRPALAAAGPSPVVQGLAQRRRAASACPVCRRSQRPARRTAANMSALATGLTLKPAPLESTDLRFPINLATALRLSDARPLIVAAAQAGVWVAEAELTRAKVLWVPTLNIGFDYIRHDGGGPDFNKGIMTAPSVNFFYGGGGMSGNISTTDAILQPLVARQVLNARHWDIQTAKNDALLADRERLLPGPPVPWDLRRRLYSVERGRDLVDRIAT